MTTLPRPCDLCGLPVGARPVPLRTAERELQFCCEGCRGIHELVHGPEDAPAPGAAPRSTVASNR